MQLPPAELSTTQQVEWLKQEHNQVSADAVMAALKKEHDDNDRVMAVMRVKQAQQRAKARAAVQAAATVAPPPSVPSTAAVTTPPVPPPASSVPPVTTPVSSTVTRTFNAGPLEVDVQGLGTQLSNAGRRVATGASNTANTVGLATLAAVPYLKKALNFVSDKTQSMRMGRAGTAILLLLVLVFLVFLLVPINLGWGQMTRARLTILAMSGQVGVSQS